MQNHLFQEMVASHGESIRSQPAVFLHGKHQRTSDPLGNPRQMTEPDSLGGVARLLISTPPVQGGGGLRLSTLICWRRAKISASRRTLDWNSPMSAPQSNLSSWTIGQQHHPIRTGSPAVRSFRQGQGGRPVGLVASG
jgi:hypothetical protein